VLLCYITDRKQFPGSEAEQRRRLLAKIAEAAVADVDYIQLREKDVPPRSLEHLARDAVRAVRENSASTRLLINSRLDLALACGADGVHLTSTDISAADARAIAGTAEERRHAADPARAARPFSSGHFLIGVSAHTVSEVALAHAQGADFAVFGAVFGKVSAPRHPAMHLDELKRACTLANSRPADPQAFGVLALGGVTLDNARLCLDAGATGIAAIRLFQDNTVAEVVRALRVK
jgi:thiamine-phosphate pyrophosphorylase